MRRLGWLIAVLALVGAACDGGSDPVSATNTPVMVTISPPSGITYLSTPTPTPAWTQPQTPEITPAVAPVGFPHGTDTGIPEVDALIAALEDTGGVPQEMWRFRPEPCVAAPINDYGPPPVCPEGMTEGTPIHILSVSGCHGGYATRDSAVDTFNPGRGEVRLFGLARPGHRVDPRAEYTVVVSFAVNTDIWGMAYEVGQGGVVGINGGCGTSPEWMWERVAPVEVILPPPPPSKYAYAPETHIEGAGVANEVIAAIAFQRPAEIRQLLDPDTDPCVAFDRERNLDRIGPPRVCPNGVDVGTVMPSLLSSGCHFGWRTEQEAEAGIFALVEGRPLPFGVRSIEGWPDERARLVVIFVTQPDSSSPLRTFAVLVGDGIVGYDSGCGLGPAGVWSNYDEYATGELLAPR